MSALIKYPRFQSLIIVVAGLLFIGILVTVKPYNSLNNNIADRLFLEQAPSPGIIIAGIDDKTLEEYGAWSHWSRSLHARAIDNLEKAGALVIGLDILFSDASDDDPTLVESIQNAGNVVLPLAGVGILPSSDSIITYTDILSPASVLNTSGFTTGHTNILQDTDGTVRRLPLVIQDTAGNEYPSFDLAVLQSLFASPLPLEYTRENGTLRLFSRNIPVDANYNFRIDFSTDNKNRPYISYGDIISGNFDPGLVENKIVLVGMTATGEQDKWMVPDSAEKLPGVYIHATVIDDILNQRFVTEAGSFPNIIILLALLGIAAVVLPRLSLKAGSLVTVLLLAVFAGTAFFFLEKGYIIGMLYPLCIPPFCFVGNIVVRNTSTLIENAQLKNEIDSGYADTIRALAASIEAKDHYTRGHSQRVTEYSLMTAAALGISEAEMKVLEYAAILHDIGKIGIPDTVLTKPDRLDNEEWNLIKLHPLIGSQIIEEVTFLNEVKMIVLHHHEKWDGTGYPEGLEGEMIPSGARIIAVADSFDSMTTDRAYRSAMTADEALQEIKRCEGTQFCPVTAKAFVQAFETHRKILPNT